MIGASIDLRADLRGRHERVRAGLRARGLGGLIVYEPAFHAADRVDEIFYLTDFRSLGPALLAVPLTGEPVLIAVPEWDRARAAAAPGVGRAVAVGRGELFAKLAEVLRGWKAPIGLSGGSRLTAAEQTALRDAVGAIPARTDDVVAALAAVRTPLELERVERAAAIADIGFNAVRQLARPGMREYELAAEVEAAMQGEGADDNAIMLASGPSNSGLRFPGERRLVRGDTIVSSIGAGYHGYAAQLARTFVLDVPSDEQRRAYRGVVQAQLVQLRLTGPGSRRRTGSGESVLERNMTLVVDASRMSPDGAWLACADTVAIVDEGSRRMTQTPLELFGNES